MRALILIAILTGAMIGCGESHLQNGSIIAPIVHDASACPTAKDIPSSDKMNISGLNGLGIEVRTNDERLNHIVVDGHQHSRSVDAGKTTYIYRAGCKDKGYTVNYMVGDKHGTIVVEKTKSGYISTTQFGDEKAVARQLAK